VVVTAIAVFGAIPWAALQHLEVLILIWNAQQIERVGKGYSMVEIVRNTGQIGTQALANTLMREGRSFRVITGYDKSKRTALELSRFFRVLHAAAVLKKARLLAVGTPFPGMTDVELEPDYLLRHLGASIINLGVEDLNRAYEAVPETEVKKHIRQLKQTHEVENLTHDETQRSVRLCEAVQGLAEGYNVNAGTLNCHGPNCLRNTEIGVTACYSLGVQNTLGRPFTCTGDLPTALAMLLLKTLSGVAMYTEVQVMDEKRRAVVIANSGEGEDAMRRKGCDSVVQGNTNFKGAHGRGASFAYPLEPGPATIVSLTPTPKNAQPFRLIAAEGKILDDPLPDAGALAGFFRFAHTDLHTGYTRWLEAGAVHHAGTTSGHWARELAEVAALLNMEFVGI
jgi:L-arabinose isomerase